jgi:hypothetical protein
MLTSHGPEIKADAGGSSRPALSDVSTTCGSGWLISTDGSLKGNCNGPLPQAVLTPRPTFALILKHNSWMHHLARAVINSQGDQLPGFISQPQVNLILMIGINPDFDSIQHTSNVIVV